MGKAAMGSASFCMLMRVKKYGCAKSTGALSASKTKVKNIFVLENQKQIRQISGDDNCLMFSLLLFNGCCFEEY
jgi:hypothetical protein